MNAPRMLKTKEMAEVIRVQHDDLLDLSRKPGCPALNVGTKKRRCLRWPLEETLEWFKSLNAPSKQVKLHTAPSKRPLTRQAQLARADELKQQNQQFRRSRVT